MKGLPAIHRMKGLPVDAQDEGPAGGAQIILDEPALAEGVEYFRLGGIGRKRRRGIPCI